VKSALVTSLNSASASLVAVELFAHLLARRFLSRGLLSRVLRPSSLSCREGSEAGLTGGR